METPILIVNFKTYAQATGKKAVELAKICEKVAIEKKKHIAVAVQAPDLFRVSQAVSIPVLAEHMDPEEPGSHTGSITAEDIKANGGVGTLLNHSEDRYRIDVLEATIVRAKRADLLTVVCANNDEIAEAIAAFGPDFIAVEPPELIGGTRSVSTANPQVVKKAVAKVKKVDASVVVLCGAGVHTGKDVKKALSLGAEGVLLASGVTMAKDPEKVLLDLVSGLPR